MKKSALVAFILFFILSCGKEKASIMVWIKDAPPPQDVQHIYLTVYGLAVKSTEGDTTVLEDYPYTFDVIGLTGGFYTSLTYNIKTGESFIDIEPGDYTDIIIGFARNHYLVRDTTGALIIPSDQPQIYELNHPFSLSANDNIILVIDLDASKSINWVSVPYEFTPSLTIFESTAAGYIGGTVRDSSGTAIRLALCEAANSTDTLTTWTNSNGRYVFMLPVGTYDISASAEGYTISDTTYEGITVILNSVLDSHNFILE